MADEFRIGDARFAIADETGARAEGGGMIVSVCGVPMPFDEDLHAEAFDPDDGEAAPRFDVDLHLYDLDATREVTVVGGRGEEHFYLYERGFRYGTRFHGTVSCSRDRIRLDGVLSRETGAEGGVPVAVDCGFEPVALVAKTRTFKSLEDAAAAPAGTARRLELTGFRELPDAVFDHPELAYLYLGGGGIEVLPDRIGDFAGLRELVLYDLKIRALPETIGRLAALERLAILQCPVETLPEAIGELSALADLTVSRTALVRLPGSIGRLTSLRELDLTGNRLTSLPDSVGALPELSTLKLKRNAFTSLPASLQRIETVEIEPAARALYRSTEYRPELTASLDPESLLVRSDAALLRRLDDACAQHDFERLREPLRHLARKAVAFTAAERDDGTVGGTRFGGAPDLPVGVAHPQTDGSYWLFLAQIDLAEIAPLQDYLPRSGLLSFFVSDLDQVEEVAVLHLEAPASGLSRFAYPEGFGYVDSQLDGEQPEAFRARPRAIVSIPHSYGAAGRFGEVGELLAEFDDDDVERYDDMLHELASAAPDGEEERALQALLGADFGRETSHVVNGFVFTQHESPEERAAEASGGLPGEWLNLMEFGSDNRVGFSFWDAGTLTVSIHAKDLAAGDFSRVRAVIESS